MDLVKKLKFFNLCLFFRKIGWDFSKGVSPWFWSKNQKISIVFFLAKKSQKNVFDDVLKREKAFLYYKKKEFKNMKNWDISKGVSPWF